jgi:hypothetical protein
MWIFDWRLGRSHEQLDLPNLPEVRRLMRLAWLNGLTFGALERQVAEAKQEAFIAIERSHSA